VNCLPNEYFIGISKLNKDEISLHASVLKIKLGLGNSNDTKIFTSLNRLDPFKYL